MATNVQAIVKGRILGTSVDGGFIKDDNSTKVVLYGKAEGDQGFVTLKEFTDGLSNGFASEKEEQKIELSDKEKGELSKKITAPFGNSESGSSVLEKIRVKLSSAYLYKSITKNPEGLQANSSTLKYALHVVVDMDSLINKNFPVDVDSISLRIWSSNVPEKIKTDMKISEMQGLIDSASGPEPIPAATNATS